MSIKKVVTVFVVLIIGCMSVGFASNASDTLTASKSLFSMRDKNEKVTALHEKLTELGFYFMFCDTVIYISTKRACLRFYGDESIAFYTAHMKKGLKGLLEDNVLPLLTDDTKVMHDHNTVNYNPLFHFQNLECDQHLERDGQKNADDTGHEWSLDLKEHIASTIHDRNLAEQKGFSEILWGKMTSILYESTG